MLRGTLRDTIKARIPLNMRGYASTTALSITDPLVIYQSQVKRGILQSDADQLRAAVALQKLYHRVRDYTPPEATQLEIKRVVSRLEHQHRDPVSSAWAARRRHTKSQELVKVLSDVEELADFPSPHGLLINGDVGTGKSMLMDMFAQSLPKQSKQRWHYQNFILWCYSEIHSIHERRKRRGDDFRDEFILFEIAQKMVRKNTVLMLDEFMLPDLTAAKIIKLLFTYFFKLGGVLVATSNRLPEDLYATDFRKAEFREFLKVLEARCNSLDMDSSKDYRSLMCESDTSSNIVISGAHSKHDLFELANLDPIQGSKTEITVYGRQVQVPWSSNGIAMFDFNDICAGLYGPGDYISLASNFHTFLITNVPILKLNMRNEARRFITLLDALYECKCQVYMELADTPENLFFPETKTKSPEQINLEVEELNRIKVQEEEMFSKTSIALNSPYRPNISYYDDEKIQYNEDKQSFQSFDLSETTVNYANQKAFTGEDEKFAYKRAVSRLKEMNSMRYKEIEWQPLQHMMRPWETKSKLENDITIKHDQEHDNDTSSFVNSASGPAPTFAGDHFWSMGLWGKGERLNAMARRWIKGVTA
ncbi:CYFA0S01e19988g1_1 [Cyberlindnera fabianii]|uniref:CYFA0S01e19988g1_1 n=1 Tax=Cyberlindnera fabianii TaxID=36022 RepID=A0A061ATH9_CYBFA|nr:CYFA0S01e19988g1_1 [Cyberlindnera fabianii]